MDEQSCPHCGKELAGGLGQHAENVLTGQVTCPHCGREVALSAGGAAPYGDVARAEAAPPGRTEPEASFSGEETLSALRAEVEDKPT